MAEATSSHSGPGTRWESVRTWMRAHRAATVLRIGFIFLQGLFGAAGGWLFAWGPFDGSTAVSALLALLVGLNLAGLWSLQQVASVLGERGQARSMRRWLIAAPLSLVLAVLVLAAWQSYHAALLPPRGGDRLADFDRLWSAVNRNYPYFDQNPIDWAAVRETYRPQAAAAPDAAAYFNAVGTMLAELGDGHTNLLNPWQPYGCDFAVIEEMEGQPTVVLPGKAATGEGLVRGSVIRQVDGIIAADAMAGLDLRLRSGSSPQQQRRRAMSHLLFTPIFTSQSVTFETPAGVEEARQLYCQPGTGSGSEAITSYRLDSGLGFIRVPHLQDRRLVAQFDQAIDALADTPGLILDLRGNGGGNSLWADDMAGRLLEKPFVYGTERFRTRLPQRGWRSLFIYRVTPRGRPYQGKVAVLIDSGTTSSAEMMAAALADSGRVMTVGRTTAGSSGNPVQARLTGGGLARYSTGDFRRSNGERIEGRGIVPDVPVTWTRADLLAGRDPDLQAAEQELLAQQ